MESVETEVMAEAGKRDERGRRIVNEEERERLLEEYDRSGLTQKKFCKREGINYHTFVTWLGRRRHNGKDETSDAPHFQEIMLAPRSSGADLLEVALPGGETVRGYNAESVAKLVELLRR